MCVTNTIKRRPVSMPLASPTMASSASMISKRLLGGMQFLPFESDCSAFASTEATYSNQCNMYNVEAVAQPQTEKPRPKRRRKPQKPGKTAKMNDRHFVVHNYHDHAYDHDENDHSDEEARRRGGVAIAFPLKLHAVLDQVEADGLGHVISWQPHGRCFVVHKPKEFVDHVMPKYFRQTKLTSFQRQLNLYGFCRLTRGADAGGYYHELFLRGMTFLCNKMIRTKVKGTRFKAASSPENEPDFYKMNPVTVTPQHSSDEEASVETDIRQMQRVPALPSQASFDPLPLAYDMFQVLPQETMQAQQFVPQQLSYASIPDQISYMPDNSQRSYADKVLDEAVNELFLNEAAWDPIANAEDDDASIQDAQLGMLLEQLLDE